MGTGMRQGRLCIGVGGQRRGRGDGKTGARDKSGASRGKLQPLVGDV